MSETIFFAYSAVQLVCAVILFACIFFSFRLQAALADAKARDVGEEELKALRTRRKRLSAFMLSVLAVSIFLEIAMNLPMCGITVGEATVSITSRHAGIALIVFGVIVYLYAGWKVRKKKNSPS